MERTRIISRYISAMLLFTILWSLISSVVFYFCFPTFYFPFYPVIPIYFFLFSVLIFYKIDEKNRTPQNRMIVFMGLKMLKLVISIILLIIYCWFQRQSAVELTIAFVINYFIYLGVDIKTWNVSRPVVDEINNKEIGNDIVS